MICSWSTTVTSSPVWLSLNHLVERMNFSLMWTLPYEKLEILHILELNKFQRNQLPTFQLCWGQSNVLKKQQSSSSSFLLVLYLGWCHPIGFVEIDSGWLVHEHTHILWAFVLGGLEPTYIYGNILQWNNVMSGWGILNEDNANEIKSNKLTEHTLTNKIV